mmetsp:Transcript_3233/g.4727  ORF Transcript_3233/g.4727 Transcript_3233/m.4727 type:complete len:338 (-) Transcript_3233:220-1233(-)|eukprot:CAMPEP_0113938130 /NCGR_PEP_ID=MMETSP1339-20121228/4531_1 /TAXON_ID=94617 /ORGANISM="Fibrocapsa japonica" /LENGTH=337 /DNA_ID=CAMNT_0000941083 /DNA_START=54 /DNA_END=1067 /DNA_ORIENTATION=- /assembly_acc=CAM_ASM_000762
MAGLWSNASEHISRSNEVHLIQEVQIDGLAVLKMVKHCSEALPQMVAGSLLGLDQRGVLEVTHAFPCPSPKSTIDDAGNTVEVDDVDGQEYQMEMMKMLREVNVDNNCVGWYQSMYLGSFCTSTLIENQFSYQENLSDNSVVILYDPIQTAHGNLTIKAFRLSQRFLSAHKKRTNEFVPPSQILEELPLKIKNPGLLQALVFDIQDRSPAVAFERLDLGSQQYLEKNLEFLCTWVDDLCAEHQKFQQFARSVSKNKQEQLRWVLKRRNENELRRERGEPPLSEDPRNEPSLANGPGPSRLESLLIINQINTYCNQMNAFSGSSFGKIFLAGSLHKDS